MKQYAVIDTNVLVSGLISRNEESSTVKILKYLSEDKIIPVFSSDIIKEYCEVLRRDKFKLPENVVAALVQDITAHGYEITETVEVTDTMPDPKDIVFYAVTLSTAEQGTYLVTGNGKHFPVKPFVVTPAELIQIIEAGK